jgi:hypothetical protein
MHGLLFGAAHILAEDAVTLLDQFPVDVLIIGRNDRTDVLILAAGSEEYILNE